MTADRSSAWTDERQATLERMAAAGARCRDIAAAVGLTRNAVIGRAHRTGVTLSFKAPRAPKLPREPRIIRAKLPRKSRALGNNPHLCREEIETLRRMYLAGDTYEVIASELGLKSTVAICYHTRDLPRRRHFDVKRYALQTKAEAVAQVLAGKPQARVAKSFGAQEVSVAQWRRNLDVLALARPMAAEIIARRDLDRGLQCLAEEQAAATEAARLAAVNGPVLARMNARHRDICERRIAGETLQQVGDRFGVSRERVRQIEAVWRTRGLEVPGTKPLSPACLRAGFIPTGAPRGPKPKVPKPQRDVFALAHAILDGKRRPYTITIEERARRAEHMRRVAAERRGAALAEASQ